MWSPAGDRIAYQRCEGGHECGGLVHDVVLVSVADGSETVIEPPTWTGVRGIPQPSRGPRMEGRCCTRAGTKAMGRKAAA